MVVGNVLRASSFAKETDDGEITMSGTWAVGSRAARPGAKSTTRLEPKLDSLKPAKVAQQDRDDRDKRRGSMEE